ncbi:uncharacterized protein Z518_10452 [Rhinocladiella mackenziei CBS 650.93]|uniref:Rhinocladiella mackenziei CBS 650.93 unplaced genomic scaffold supercont1.9, whole genome shotgun sequence n=1 Tax=Rhinocladiella mackenziei CBS 650.93 TaxID=1442369 RepID=A0A0D2GPM2_9EURO|nr:uncharacterized protein Z518_10452 [Rhinocladiella mackenziei CBS 650.93]KIX00313.1 hypothetical protein Z518_10452 [Rhinocladiella mackenziei CBS 650.93]
MASAFHRCQHCGYETDLSSNLAVFEDNPHCRQCGLSASESDTKMQDDLINMMTRNLQLSPIQHQHDMSMPPTPQVVPQPAPITYITQHYHHSAHQVPSHELPVSTLLERSGINASALFPSQLQLFKNAEPEQRSRLIELWQIAPPTYGNQIHPKDLGNWPQTNMEREEEAAKYRLQMLEQEKLKNLCALPGHENRHNAEPYILQGYDTLSNINGVTAPMEYGSTPMEETEYKQSKDPAYNSREWWHLSDDEPMEHQYGMLQQMYGYHLDCSAERRNDGDAEMS